MKKKRKVCVIFGTFSEMYLFLYFIRLYFSYFCLLLHLRTQKVTSYIPSVAVILKTPSLLLHELI